MLQLGTLTITSAVDRSDLLAAPTAAALAAWAERDQVGVAEIDPDLADTAAFCAAYDVPLAASANCVVLAGKREGEVRMAACVVLATTRADVNNVARRWLDVRKISFASMDDAVALTGMEYGGITPIGLPADWPILVDSRVMDAPTVVIGSGVRRSKIVLPGSLLSVAPGAHIIDALANPIAS
ncbi:MAG: YbaK/EbsC family protein [Actinomycetales bacterium]|nr:YbaK/EbsC family protein [Actinomycetales bacterium]